MMLMAGPSQQHGWAGHGHYAPLNIPNIFKAAGINTRWIPGQDPVFQVGLLYPSPPSQSSPPSPPPPPPPPPPAAYSGAVKVKKSIPKTQYSEYKQSTRVELPAVPPPYSGPPPTTPAPTPTSTTTTTTVRPTTTTGRALRYSPAPSYSRSPPSYQYSGGIGWRMRRIHSLYLIYRLRPALNIQTNLRLHHQ